MATILGAGGLVATLGLEACGKSRHHNRGEAGGDVSRGGLNIYAATGANDMSAVALRSKRLVYVPNSQSASVTVIDPSTYTVVRTFRTGAVPQHVVPSYDMNRLWVLNNKANTVTPVDPFTGTDGSQIHVDDPYNMYYTPDGRFAVVIAEKDGRLDFLDPQTMKHVRSLHIECKGLDHVEFTADGRYLIGTCEFSGELVKVDLAEERIVGYLLLDPKRPSSESMPQDIRSSPDGGTFYVADMQADGVWTVDPLAFRVTGFIKTGVGTHGIYPSRDGRLLYVTNRGWHTTNGGLRGPGSISVIDPSTNAVTATWPIPGGGSPDMGNVTADGRELWVSGRYDSEVYVIDTRTGALTHRIPVGRGPHGLCVWPQPGRYSLGHTGNMR